MPYTKKLVGADKLFDIKFECLGCGYTEMVRRMKHQCPKCKEDGWSLSHTFPVVEGPPIVVRPRSLPWGD